MCDIDIQLPDLATQQKYVDIYKVLKQEYLSEQDKDDIVFGIENGVDFIACSFVSCKQDLIDIKEFLKEKDGKGIELIAKIENRSGVEKIEEIRLFEIV